MSWRGVSSGFRGSRGGAPTRRRRHVRYAVIAVVVAMVCIACGGPPFEQRVDGGASNSPVTWGGQAFAIAVNPNTPDIAYLATAAGGLYETNDRGVSWTMLQKLAQFTVEDVAIDPSDPSNVFVATRGDTRSPSQSGVWYSRNGGATWSRAALDFPCLPLTANTGGATGVGDTPSAFEISIVPPWVFAATDCGVRVGDLFGNFDSYAAGNYSPGLTSPRFYSVAASRIDSSTVRVYACGPSGVYTRAVGNVETPWIAKSLPALVDGPSRCHVAVSPNSSQNVAVQLDWRLYQSTNGGVAWSGAEAISHTSQDDGGGGIHRLIFRPSDTVSGQGTDLDLYWSTGFQFYKERCPNGVCPLTNTALAIDSGTHDDPSDMGFDPNPQTGADCAYYMVNDGGVDVSSDCGQTWVTSNHGVRALQVASMCGTYTGPDSSQTDLYIAMQHNDIWGSTNGGHDWIGVDEGIDGATCEVDSANFDGIRLFYADNRNSFMADEMGANYRVWPRPLGLESYGPGTPTMYGHERFAQFSLASTGPESWQLWVMQPESKTDCSNTRDDDNDGAVNDGCDARRAPGDASPTAETGIQCHNGVDDDNDGFANDGCSAMSSIESGTECSTATDEDSDGRANDGCDAFPAAPGKDGQRESYPGQCGDGIDDDNDGTPDDGCPEHANIIGPSGEILDPQCNNNMDDDGDGVINDGCPEIGIWTAVSTPVAGHARTLHVTGPETTPRFYYTVDSASAFQGALWRIQGPLNTTAQTQPTNIKCQAAFPGPYSPCVHYFGQSDFHYDSIFDIAPSFSGSAVNDLIEFVDENGNAQRSTNGGANISQDTVLTNLVTRQPQQYLKAWWDSGNLESQVRVIAFDPNPNLRGRVAVGTAEAGVFTSGDGGAFWRMIPHSGAFADNGSGTGPRAVTSFFFDDLHNRLWFSSYGRGLWWHPATDAFQ
jgi:hypothetical protein